MNTLFESVFEQTTTEALAVPQFLISVAAALILGAVLAAVYSYKTRYTKSFMMTMFLIPAIVAVVIMMVNGNIGAGVAVAGTFSLVRFRSVPGTAKEIAAIFMAMGLGLICGMGFVAYAVIYTVIIGACMFGFSATRIGEKKENEKTLRITIPEDLNYTEVFDEDLGKYTDEYQLNSVKTTNMGSLFKLTYRVRMKDPSKEKEFIDALRVKNGNLEIMMAKAEEVGYEL